MGTYAVDPIVTEGENLTQILIDDFAPFVWDKDGFADYVHKSEAEYGSHITKIVAYPFPNGKPGIMEKHYFFESDTECPDWELNAITSGVESL